jgi:mRNA interferase MazF
VTYADIHWATLPDRAGHEQRGRRPVVIWQDTTAFPAVTTILVIPLTSRLNTLRFPGTLLVQPTNLNQLAMPSVALVFQLGACDVRRIGGRLGRLDDADLLRIQDLARRLQAMP